MPVVEMIDQRLSERRGDGYRYKEMPEDWEAWPRQSRESTPTPARKAGRPFCDLQSFEQDEAIDHVRLAEGEWHEMPAGRIFELWMRYVCDAFYSHPWAWNEIGFGGPALPPGLQEPRTRPPRALGGRAGGHPVDPVAEERTGLSQEPKGVRA